MKTMQFESSVISYGSKTGTFDLDTKTLFESSVISYGSKTEASMRCDYLKFESSVIYYDFLNRWLLSLLSAQATDYVAIRSLFGFVFLYLITAL